jgi:hypothetical protein
MDAPHAEPPIDPDARVVKDATDEQPMVAAGSTEPPEPAGTAPASKRL